MNLKEIILATVLCFTGTSLFASDYYVVVPVPGRTPALKDTVAGPSLSANQLNFGVRQRGDVGLPLVLTLSNPGTKPLTITQITVPDAGVVDGFSLQHDCAVLAPAASCTGYVYYRAAVTGDHTSSLRIEHDGWRRTTQVPLSGSTRDPSASLTIAQFGDVNVGSAKDRLAVLTNTGVGNIAVGAPVVSGTGYSIMASDCPTPLGPAQSCNITARLTAGATGPLTGQLNVSTGAGALSAALAGRGVSSDLQITSGPVPSFGSVATGASAVSGTVTLKNTGNITADGLALRVAGADDYTIENNTCGTALPAGGTCSFAVRFAPQSAGAQLADLQAVVGDNVAASSPLSGVGTSAAVFLTASVQNSVVLVGTVNYEYYTVTNSSSSPVTITSKALAHPEPALTYGFHAGTNECPDVIPAKASCRLNFALQASDLFASKQLALTLNTSAGKLTASTMGVSASWAVLETSPVSPAFDFGNVVLGNSVVSTKVTVTNKASATNAITASYVVPEGFEMVNSSCGTTSVRTTTCELYLKFSPTAAKAYKGTFTMTTRTQYTGTGGTPQPYVLSIPLSGVGTVPTAVSWQGGLTDVVEKGTTRPVTLTLYNPSASSVVLGSVTLGGNTTEFQLTGTTCGASLAANSSCTATLAFTPADTGVRQAATVSVAAAGVPVTKSVSGTAGTAVLTATPSPLSFPARYPNLVGVYDAFKDIQVTVKNTGTAAAENLVDTISYNGQRLSFSFQYNSCLYRLNPGSSCRVNVRAIGTVVGDHSGTVSFSSASGRASVPFTFSIVPMDIGVVEKVPVQDTVVGKGTVATYTITTNNTGKIVVDVPTISGNTAEYSLAAGSNCSGIIQLNSTCTINVLFTPTASGPRPAATLNVNAGGILRAINLAGAGVAP